ncbi:lipo-like protein [Vibrio sp. T187]|uniref:YbaY family lipoprotein n=1 Tax=Vibrio TaxID=662 RepID=UPI0010C96501|nr:MULTISPECIES: YbaY family lipoprotein [Vibrio]MBW3694560.1 lipo-like protein [Vibrio sp. T187]
MRKALILMMSAIIGSIALVGCQSAPEPQLQVNSTQSISGTVSYRERIALPEGAMVTIVLEDVSLADAPAKVIAKHRFETNGQQVPLSFDLAYDSRKIQERHRYNVRAKIEVNGRLRFTTDTIVPVVTDSDATQHVDLRLVGVR